MRNSVKVYDKHNLSSLEWGLFDKGEQFRNYFEPLILLGTSKFISNLNVEIKLLTIDNQIIPLAFGNNKIKNQSYVASNIGQYLNYPIDELNKLNILQGVKKQVSLFGLRFLKFLSINCNFDNCIFVNAFLLSSNLWNPAQIIDVHEIKLYLQQHFPEKSIIFKGITEEYHNELLKSLVDNSGKKVFSRELFFLDPKTSNYKKKRPFIIDRKHAESNADMYQWFCPVILDDSEKSTFLNFYKSLYLGKYSDFNPEYTIDFIDLVSKCDFFTTGKIMQENELLGAQIIFSRGGEITTPFIGYNRDLPQEMGIYRLLNYYLIEEARKGDVSLNMSSGAGNFKKQRGGISEIEYNVVIFPKSFSLQRIPWNIFEFLGRRFLIPNLSKLNL